MKTTLEEAREKLREIVAGQGLGGEAVDVTVGTLTAKEAIGTPERGDYPLLEGREVMVEARFKRSRGQAFTDNPCAFLGSLNDILEMEPDTSGSRAILAATMNAVTAHLGKAKGTRHCRDQEPELCAAEIARHILANHGRIKVGLIGYQPAILASLAGALGAANVRCTDLNPKNIGTRRAGAEIWDGRADTGRLIQWCDLLLVTSSTITNNTIDGIRAEAEKQGKKLIIFGVTGAAVSALLGIERLCFHPH